MLKCHMLSLNINEAIFFGNFKYQDLCGIPRILHENTEIANINMEEVIASKPVKLNQLFKKKTKVMSVDCY